MGELLQLPVIYSARPSDDIYYKQHYEIDAVPFKQRTIRCGDADDEVEGGDDYDGDEVEDGDDDYDGDYGDEMDGDYSNTLRPVEARTDNDDNNDHDGDSGGGGDGTQRALLQLSDFVPLLDYTLLAPYVWVDGIREPTTGRYIDNMTPMLRKRNISHTSYINGYRSTHTLEAALGITEDGSDQSDSLGRGEARSSFMQPTVVKNRELADYLYRTYHVSDGAMGEGKTTEGDFARLFLEDVLGRESPPPMVERETFPQDESAAEEQDRISGLESLSRTRRGSTRRVTSIPSLLFQRQRSLNIISGRAERVDKEKEKAKHDRERRTLDRFAGLKEVDDQSRVAQEGVEAVERTRDEEDEILEEGEGVDDLW